MPAAEESLMEPVEENTENPPSPRHQYEPPQRQRILEVMRLGTEKETNQKTRQKTQPNPGESNNNHSPTGSYWQRGIQH